MTIRIACAKCGRTVEKVWVDTGAIECPVDIDLKRITVLCNDCKNDKETNDAEVPILRWGQPRE